MKSQSTLQRHQDFSAQEDSRLFEELPDPSVICKDGNTINKPFGSFDHFSDYLRNKTGSASRLDTKLTSSPCYYQTDERMNRLRKKIVDSLKEAATAKAETDRQAKEYMEQALKIKQLLKDNSNSLDDFLSVIIKIYTMEFFAGYWLNELLRKENWLQVNLLMPLLMCLVHVFKASSKFEVKCEDGKSSTLCLYRGAALTQKQIDLYNDEKVDLFSWNALTSTSRSLKVAEKFIGLSLIKAPEKVGVLFKIQVPFGSKKDREGMIDVSKQSKYPKEEEIILAPGTVFKLLDVHLNDNNKIYEISLSVVKEFKKSAKVLGNLHNQVIIRNKAIIDNGLSLLEVFEVLKLLKGNTEIRKLEIWNLGIDEDLLEEIENVRIATKLKKKNVKFVGNKIAVKSQEYLVSYLAPERMRRFGLENTISLTN